MTDIAIPACRFWPAALMKHERDQSGVTDADLEIRPATAQRKLTESQIARVEETMTCSTYWRGAMQTRQTLGDTGRGLLLCAQIERDLIAGKALSECEGFREWREGVR